ncbi:MAG: serine/threonine protein kinase [Deltaproteobacteria bacterium]|nr:serine/threonine protein kinase [Deltaproteobacteria bacterium]
MSETLVPAPPAAPTFDAWDSGSAGGATPTLTGSGRSTVLPVVHPSQGGLALVPTLAERFAQLRTLGAGGLGEVTLARDNDIGRMVAIKRILPGRASRQAIARFVQEIRTVGRLEHPNIIPIHDVGQDEDGSLFFVMKYVEGLTLEALIAGLRDGDRTLHRAWPFERRVQVFAELLSAVAFAHAKGVIHRDLKPANVMIGGYGEVLLLDWGIARSGELLAVEGDGLPGAAPGADRGGRSTRQGALLGTPLYMSPEQARGEDVDERSDVYALSVILYELLTLHHYLEGRESLEDILEGVQHHHPTLATLVRSPLQEAVPMDLSWYLRQGLHKDPSLRYPTVQAMIDRLDRRAQGDIPVECHLTLVKRVTRMALSFMDRHPMLVSGALMVALMGVLAVLLSAAVGILAGAVVVLGT